MGAMEELGGRFGVGRQQGDERGNRDSKECSGLPQGLVALVSQWICTWFPLGSHWISRWFPNESRPRSLLLEVPVPGVVVGGAACTFFVHPLLSMSYI